MLLQIITTSIISLIVIDNHLCTLSHKNIHCYFYSLRTGRTQSPT